MRKILALAERGSEGEKDNAQRMLISLLTKYGLRVEDIREERKTDCKFTFKGRFEKKLLIHIISMVTENRSFGYRYTNAFNLIVELTQLQKVEVTNFFEFYKIHLRKELDSLIDAFIITNALFHSSEDDSGSTMTAEEIERLLRLMQSMNKIAPPRKQLT